MANKNFPGPNINRIIDTDPQIIKVPMDYTGWGSRKSAMPKQGNPANVSDVGSAPTAPEMGIKHVG